MRYQGQHRSNWDQQLSQPRWNSFHRGYHQYPTGPRYYPNPRQNCPENELNRNNAGRNQAYEFQRRTFGVTSNLNQDRRQTGYRNNTIQNGNLTHQINRNQEGEEQQRQKGTIAQRSQNTFENEDNNDGEVYQRWGPPPPQHYERELSYETIQTLNSPLNNHYQNGYRYHPYPQQRYPKEWISEFQDQNELWNNERDGIMNIKQAKQKKISNLENNQDLRRFKYYSDTFLEKTKQDTEDHNEEDYWEYL